MQFVEALKVNTTLTEIDLTSIFRLPHVLSLLLMIAIFLLKLFYLGNNLGNDGAKYIADVLKVNTTLEFLDIGCESFFCLFVFLFFRLPFFSR